MNTSRITTLLAIGFALLAPVACTEGGTTGPVAPPPPPTPAPDLVQAVTIAITGLEVTGSCDHDNIFESSSDGEFSFSFFITPSGSTPEVMFITEFQPYGETVHDVGGVRTFNRNVSRGEDFFVQFTATEFDGILGADPQLRNRVQTVNHLFQGGAWGPESNSIVLNGGKERCGVTLYYSVTSVAAG